MNSQIFSRVALGIAAVLGFSTLALAGPPMICHPIAIGQARSLPWVDLNYRKGSGDFDLNNLTKDTLAILDSDTSVLVHMETLRRATIYARQDSQAAKELIVRLHARAEQSDATSRGALALFDFGYLAETYKQWMGRGEPNPASGLDGYGLVQKSIRQRGADAEMEFAAALITMSGPEADHNDHVQKTIAGAKGDPLLAQNLSSTFGNQTISALLTHPGTR
jgi:hypothetical protein